MQTQQTICQPQITSTNYQFPRNVNTLTLTNHHGNALNPRNPLTPQAKVSKQPPQNPKTPHPTNFTHEVLSDHIKSSIKPKNIPYSNNPRARTISNQITNFQHKCRNTSATTLIFHRQIHQNTKLSTPCISAFPKYSIAQNTIIWAHLSETTQASHHNTATKTLIITQTNKTKTNTYSKPNHHPKQTLCATYSQAETASCTNHRTQNLHTTPNSKTTPSKHCSQVTNNPNQKLTALQKPIYKPITTSHSEVYQPGSAKNNALTRIAAADYPANTPTMLQPKTLNLNARNQKQTFHTQHILTPIIKPNISTRNPQIKTALTPSHGYQRKPYTPTTPSAANTTDTSLRKLIQPPTNQQASLQNILPKNARYLTSPPLQKLQVTLKVTKNLLPTLTPQTCIHKQNHRTQELLKTTHTTRKTYHRQTRSHHVTSQAHP
eukprot:gene2956-1938_t